jgi:hypothetical protein
MSHLCFLADVTPVFCPVCFVQVLMSHLCNVCGGASVTPVFSVSQHTCALCVCVCVCVSVCVCVCVCLRYRCSAHQACVCSICGSWNVRQAASTRWTSGCASCASLGSTTSAASPGCSPFIEGQQQEECASGSVLETISCCERVTMYGVVVVTLYTCHAW